MGEESPALSLADRYVFDTATGCEWKQIVIFLVSAQTLCLIFTQSTIGKCMINKDLMQIMLLMVAVVLPFVCGCIGVESGF